MERSRFSKIHFFSLALFLVWVLLPMARLHGENSGKKGKEKSHQLPPAETIGSDTCLTCHDAEGKSFQHTVHSFRKIDCEDCHGPGSNHPNDDQHGHINTFHGKDAAATNALCLRCHSKKAEMAQWISSAHKKGEVTCTQCHLAHPPPLEANVAQRKAQNEACTRCHTKQASDQNMPYHHPTREGKMSCTDCHNPHGSSSGKNLRAAGNDLCYACHAEKKGPFAFQHMPVSEDCQKCHSPHGSMFSGMTKVSQPFLCLQCHSGHHNGQSVPILNPCTNCHNSIHGTDVASATGGSVFIDKSYTAPAARAGAVTAGGSNRATRDAIDTFSYATPAIAAGSSTAYTGLNSSTNTACQVSLETGYRYVGTNGNTSRVGEYDSLKNSPGGAMDLQLMNPKNQVLLNVNGSMVSVKDYDYKGDLRVGELLKVNFDGRSLVHNLDVTPFGMDLAPDGILVNQNVPAGYPLAIQKTFNNVGARLTLPDTPVTLFVKGGQQTRSGLCQGQMFDMGSDAACTTCHAQSDLQAVNYITRDLGGGIEYDLGIGTAAYEHDIRIAQNKAAAPVNYFGLADSATGELQPGVLSTTPGLYMYDDTPGFESNSDTFRLNLRLPCQVSVSGDATYGSTINSFTSNVQNFMNSNAALNWEATDQFKLGTDYHQQEVVNQFAPAYFSSYGNPNLDRIQMGGHMDYRFTDMVSTDAYYHHTRIYRSGDEFWPQVYSPHNTDFSHLVPQTDANTVGSAVTLHRDTTWKVRSGYEWTGTTNPGYLVDPDVENRIFSNASVTPCSWMTINEDAGVSFQERADIRRRNNLYNTTTSLLFRPLSEWAITTAYAYFRNNVSTEVTYANDPTLPILYQENLPFTSETHSIIVTSKLSLTKQLDWDLDGSYTLSHSYFAPDPNAAPSPLSLQRVEFAAYDSTVNVPDFAMGADLAWKWGNGFKATWRFDFEDYQDYVHPELSGRLWSIGCFISKNF